MEPQLPTPVRGPEGAHINNPQGGEFAGVTRTPEASPAPLEKGGETREVVQDGPKGDPAAVQPAFTPPPMPQIAPTQTVVDDTTKKTSDNPQEAADADLIEKEWVEKAKQVVAETRNDPHAQESAVSQLQADYLQKRYGKTIIPSSGD